MFKSKWCEKCSIEFFWNLEIYELHNDNVVITVERELKYCPHCKSKLESWCKNE